MHIFTLWNIWLKIRNDKQLLISNSSECDNLVYWPFWEFYMMHDMTSLVKSFLSFRDWEWHLSGWSQKTHFCLKLNLSKVQFVMSPFGKYEKKTVALMKEKYSNKLSMKALLEKDILMKKQEIVMRKAPHFFMYIYLFLFCRKRQWNVNF